MYILSDKIWFPPIEFTSPEGILAIGGDLSVERLLLAYKSGIFPWYNEGEPVIWYSPERRMVLFPEKLKVSKSMQQLIRKDKFQITFNTCFSKVISNCKTINRKDQQGTWITAEMQQAYIKLHELGKAKSVEVWLDDELVGGLYGMVVGKVFCGESMFTQVSDASKSAYAVLIKHLKEWGYDFIDCQVPTNHLKSLGAKEVSREYFLQRLLKVNMDNIDNNWKINKDLI